MSESDGGQAGGRSESGGGQAGGRSESDVSELVRSEIDRNLLGGDVRYDRTQVADAVGIDLARAQQLWVAMGFPVNPDENAVMFTDADIEALKLITGLVDAEIIEQSMEVAIARTLGQSMSRLAEWQIGVVNNYVVKQLQERSSSTDADTVRREARDLAAKTVPTIESLQNYAWRRHLAAVAGRALATDSEGESSSVTCVGFADMVGYTSLTRRLGVDELTSLLEEFESVTTNTIARGRGSVIKNVGDEVMFQTSTPADAARIALHLHEAFSDREDVPDLRVGIALGPVLARFGDLYGSVVNIAARLTSVAHPGTVLVDSEMADALADDESFRLKSVRPFRVRGYRRLRPYSLRWQKVHGKGDDGDVISVSEKNS
ncbi:adenylate/guanylate cyclase domain-containing protein [Rhodococcoides trifolii]|uniref:Adenylate/guanylate cyclase domain-containing protein n=1 Tax=Rhodococcoides trifolii TaxID=908250 RepID=A0A917CM25_9NOCA|nr:adenylate/guanylate cyclase domain-containing protein [Rhodococcus trifolii]GGF92827.1 adenylate/guanylate cyclase domain-containing protein [Rhodococcus trifolii]